MREQYGLLPPLQVFFSFPRLHLSRRVIAGIAGVGFSFLWVESQFDGTGRAVHHHPDLGRRETSP
jgi:hypothetical protein